LSFGEKGISSLKLFSEPQRELIQQNFVKISLLKLNSFIKLIHEIMSWEILGRMEMINFHATWHCFICNLLSLWISMGLFICETSISTNVRSLLQIFLFQFVDWKVWQKVINYNEKVFGIEDKNAKFPKLTVAMCANSPKNKKLVYW